MASTLLLPALSMAAMYSYTDDDGHRRIVNSLGAVPEDKRADATRVGGSSSPPPPRSAPAKDPVVRSPAPRASAGGAGEVLTLGGSGFVEPTAQAVVAPGASEEDVDDDGHGEVWWQQQVASWMNRRAAAEDELRQLDAQKRILTYGRPSERTRYRRMMTEAEGRHAEAVEMIDETLPRQARAAGAPSKWLVLPGLDGPRAALNGLSR